MKRTTISWPEDLADAVQREVRRRHVSVSEIVRESVEAHVPGDRARQRQIPRAGIVDDPNAAFGRDIEAFMAKHWGEDIARNRG